MNKRDLYRLHLVLVCAVAFAGPASAATRTWSGGSDNWDTDVRWGGTEPVSGDYANVNNGDTVTVNLAGEIAGQLGLSAGSTVNVNTGGDLTLDAVSQSASLSINNGTLNVDGGTVTTEGLVNNFLNGGGEINVSAGSVINNAHALRFGDGATTGTLDVNGTGSWTGKSLVGVGTSIINLTGSDASLSLAEILMWDTTLEVNLTPGSTGIDTIDLSGRLLLGTDGGRSQTLNFDTDGYLGARTVVLFTYGSTLTGTFKTTNISRTGVGNLTLGSDPGGNPANLGSDQYYLDYGSGSGSSVTLYYNTVNAGLVAHYPLSANVNDDSGHGYNGTFQGPGGAHGSATFVSDSKFGSVLDLDGTDDRVSLGNVHTLNGNSWSISMWVKTPATANTVTLLGKNNGDTSFSGGERNFEITGSQTWGPLVEAEAPVGNFALNGFGMGGQVSKQSSIALDDGTWHMLTAVHDSSVSATDLTLYIDSVAQTAGTQTLNNNVADVGGFYLGFCNVSGTGAAGYLTGQMAEVNLYNVAIDAAAVEALYDAFIRGTVIAIN